MRYCTNRAIDQSYINRYLSNLANLPNRAMSNSKINLLAISNVLADIVRFQRISIVFDDRRSISSQYRSIAIHIGQFLWISIGFDEFRSLPSIIPVTRVRYPAELHEINALNLLVHGGNSAVVALELALTAHPVRAAHALYAAGAGLGYGLFSALYWAAGGTDRLGLAYIYPTLDWNKPGTFKSA